MRMRRIIINRKTWTRSFHFEETRGSFINPLKFLSTFSDVPRDTHDTDNLFSMRTLQKKRNSYSTPSASHQLASHPINHINTPPDAGRNVLALGFSSLNRPASHHLISSSVGVPCTSHFNIFHIIITRVLQPI